MSQLQENLHFASIAKELNDCAVDAILLKAIIGHLSEVFAIDTQLPPGVYRANWSVDFTQEELHLISREVTHIAIRWN